MDRQTEKGNGKGTQKGGKFKGGKGGNRGEGKGKGKKGQRVNKITEPPKEQWTGGSWEQWLAQSWSAEIDTASWRDDDWRTADSNSQTSAAAEDFQRASVGDLRLLEFGLRQTHRIFFNVTDWILHSELSNLVLIPQHAKLLFPLITLQHVVFGPQRFITGMCVQHYKPRQSVQGKRILCTLEETGKPVTIESRKVDCRRPLVAVTEMTDCRSMGLFWTTKARFQF